MNDEERNGPDRTVAKAAIFKRSIAEFNADQIPAWAGGVTFFGLLAIFPALSAFILLYTLVADPNNAQHLIAEFSGLLPGGAISVIDDQLKRLAAAKSPAMGLGFVTSLVMSLWSANAGVKALFGALNVAYDLKENRSFIVLNLTSLTFTSGLVLFGFLGAIMVAAVPDTLRAVGLGDVANLAILRWPLILIVVSVVLALVYRFGPCHGTAKWRWISPGSLVGSVGWVAVSICFSWYAQNFGHFNATYGVLGGVVGFMTWIWLSLLVLLYGAELNAEVARVETENLIK